MTTLKKLYEIEGSELLDRIHDETRINRKYLYHLATQRRRPSARMAARIIAAEPRLSLESLLLDGQSA